MKRIDFKHFEMFQDISQTSTMEQDISHDFADFVYKNANGVMAHDIAMRIYKSDGPIDLTDEELALLTTMAEICTPIFADSFHANIKDIPNNTQS